MNDNFWKFVEVKGPDDCWIWRGGRQRGYGAFYNKGNVERAHRISYIIEHGNIDNKLLVLHSCDNKLCVNPKHLRQGSHIDNVHDAMNKELYNNNKKLNTEAVKVIKWMLKYRKNVYGIGNKLARLYNVDKVTISLIKRGKIWSRVEV